MLSITVQKPDEFNDETQRFIYHTPVELMLEHSLVSLSKWESKYKVPFLNNNVKSNEEMYDYIKFMLINPMGIPEEMLYYITQDQMDQIGEYIQDSMTATWFYDPPGAKGSKEIITAEVIYHWMVVHRIDFQCQYWHLNRLITLVRVCSEKHPDAKPRKKSRGELVEERRRINQQRKRELGTSG